MTTAGERVKQERKRQRIPRRSLAQRLGISDKTLERIEAGERDGLLFMVEEALGLPPSAGGDAADEDAILRAVPDRKFWLEAARRAILTADAPTAAPQTALPELPTENLFWDDEADVGRTADGDEPDTGNA